ncbi:MAG: AAA family ATPase, partial [Oxalobacteraceae bacterium]
MEIDIRTLLGKLNPECKRAMGQAAELCVRQTQFNVELEHLLLVLMENRAPDLVLLLERFGIAEAVLAAQLHFSLDGFKRGNGRTPALSSHFVPLFQEAWMLGSMLLGTQQVRSGTVVLAMLEVDALRGVLLETAPVLLQIPRQTLKNELAVLLSASSEDGGAAAGAPAMAPVPSAPARANGVHQAAPGKTPALDQYTVDLTAQARAGRIDPVRGRDPEIRQLVDILLRRRQNNPILTGEAGVGKTAVVEGFAQRIAQGLVPPALATAAVRSLDLALLQAGAGIKGEFENRLKSVIAEVRASATPVILFIDEAHQLIGAGGAEGQGDAANILKPALARGELRTVAATTWAEYKKYVERDPALARRFQVVKVDEPEPDAAVGMLRGMVATLEKHHQVEILDEAVVDAVRLSHRYISGRQLPDKAISVLDTACARVAIGQAGAPPQLEALQHEIVLAEEALRIARQKRARGEDRGDAIAALERQLAALRQRQARLGDKVAEERRAVEEILALRREIA